MDETRRSISRLPWLRAWIRARKAGRGRPPGPDAANRTKCLAGEIGELAPLPRCQHETVITDRLPDGDGGYSRRRRGFESPHIESCRPTAMSGVAGQQHPHGLGVAGAVDRHRPRTVIPSPSSAPQIRQRKRRDRSGNAILILAADGEGAAANRKGLRRGRARIGAIERDGGDMTTLASRKRFACAKQKMGPCKPILATVSRLAPCANHARSNLNGLVLIDDSAAMRTRQPPIGGHYAA